MKKVSTFSVIFVGFFVLLVLFVLFIPGLLSLKIAANEASARNSLRSIYKTEQYYVAVYSDRGFSCSLGKLSDPFLGEHALPPDLASGIKNGYAFSLGDCRSSTVGGRSLTGFKAFAVPFDEGKSGRKGFCVDETGKLTFDPSGGNACTESVD